MAYFKNLTRYADFKAVKRGPGAVARRQVRKRGIRKVVQWTRRKEKK